MLILRIIPFVLLAACSGAPAEGPQIVAGSFAAAQTAQNELENDLATFKTAQTVTDPATLPTTGSTLYTGGFTLSDGAGFTLVGKADITTDWDCCEVTGRAYEIITQDDEELTGELVIEHGEIVREDPDPIPFTVLADVNGALGSAAGDHLVEDVRLEGNFIGTGWDYIEGTLNGSVTSPDGVHSGTGTLVVKK